MKQNEFAAYIEKLPQETIQELEHLHAKHLHNIISIEDQHFLKNAYMHKLTQLVTDFYGTETSQQFDKQPFFDTIIVSQHNSVLLGDNISGYYKDIHYDIVYGSISNTELMPGDVEKNFTGYVMLYAIKFPSAFGFECIGWHKDILLDLAERRPHHHLNRIKLDSAHEHPFKLYADNETSAQKILTDNYFNAMADIASLDGQTTRPLDFSIENNQLSLITRSIQSPFGLTLPNKQSDLADVRADLGIVNQHVVAIRRMIDVVSA